MRARTARSCASAILRAAYGARATACASARLIDTDGLPALDRLLDRSADDVFAIQDEIAAAVSRTLKVMLLGESEHAAVATTRNAKAHDAYLRGRFLWNAHGGIAQRRGGALPRSDRRRR